MEQLGLAIAAAVELMKPILNNLQGYKIRHGRSSRGTTMVMQEQKCSGCLQPHPSVSESCQCIIATRANIAVRIPCRSAPWYLAYLRLHRWTAGSKWCDHCDKSSSPRTQSLHAKLWFNTDGYTSYGTPRYCSTKSHVHTKACAWSKERLAYIREMKLLIVAVPSLKGDEGNEDNTRSHKHCSTRTRREDPLTSRPALERESRSQRSLLYPWKIWTGAGKLWIRRLSLAWLHTPLNGEVPVIAHSVRAETKSACRLTTEEGAACFRSLWASRNHRASWLSSGNFTMSAQLCSTIFSHSVMRQHRCKWDNHSLILASVDRL